MVIPMGMTPEMAEVVGAFIGDGCISTYSEGSRRRTVVLFTGNWKTDKPYYERFIIPSIRGCFGGTRKPYHRRDDNTIRYVFCDRRITCFFLRLGMPVGVKSNRIPIPRVIGADRGLSSACIRGIFNTDGSVYARYSKKYRRHSRLYGRYAVIQFKMQSITVIAWIKETLESMGINVNRITQSSNCRIIRITDQGSVRAFFRQVGFTHPHHESRYYSIINGNESAHLRD